MISALKGIQEDCLPSEVDIQAESQIGKLQSEGQGRVFQAEEAKAQRQREHSPFRSYKPFLEGMKHVCIIQFLVISVPLQKYRLWTLLFLQKHRKLKSYFVAVILF